VDFQEVMAPFPALLSPPIPSCADVLGANAGANF
jgi:hypothetical protein